MAVPQEGKRLCPELAGEQSFPRNRTSAAGLLPKPGFLLLVPYFPVNFDIPRSETVLVAGIAFLVIGWMLCRRR